MNHDIEYAKKYWQRIGGHDKVHDSKNRRLSKHHMDYDINYNTNNIILNNNNKNNDSIKKRKLFLSISF